MTKFAAHDGFAIHAIAETAESAIAKARDANSDVDAKFSTDRISEDLATRVERDGTGGPDLAFEVRDGEIVEI